MIRRLAWLAALVVVLSSALLALLGSDDSGSRSPVAVPPGAESARAEALRSEFPGGDRAPAILVVTRADGTELSAADIDTTVEARQRMTDEAGPPVLVSDDGKAALATVPVDTGLCGFALDEAVQGLRGAAAQGLTDGLRAEVTGGPAFGADIANSFAGANITLLAVTATVGALLLIVTYRSPVLWLVPL